MKCSHTGTLGPLRLTELMGFHGNHDPKFP